MASSFNAHESAIRLLNIMQRSRGSSVSRHARTLTVGEIGLLNYLSHQEKAVSAGAIGRMIGIGNSGVTNLLNSLEKKGYIHREINLMDRRSVLVSISEEGLGLIREKQARVLDFTEKLLSRMGKEDTEELLRLLEKANCESEEILKEIKWEAEGNKC